MSRDVENIFQENLTMYPHLKAIRDRLWMNDDKSRVSVMIGAGFSLNAKKVASNFMGMALWNDLKNRLTQDLSHHQDIVYKDVLEIGQIYVEEYGRSRLDEILKEAIPDENYEPDDLHYSLLNLPWADIYTTNYDTLLERAKKSVYERNYQVIYDITDIPSSVQPRIVKLHGSFPANRPFIFTKKDYDEYPEKFSPFVNMVQQSIMETTLVLLGFSGDDPNFNKWTTWVFNNLGEHMPKIYMIGYGQKHRKSELRAKGITLIDFEEIYMKCDNPHYSMYTDLFEFLAYKKREDKTKWPHRSYRNVNLKDLQYNRETYPGWVVMPDEIRSNNAEFIRYSTQRFIQNLSTLEDQNMINYLNEILWCYEKFFIPFNYHLHKKLQQLMDTKSEINEMLIPLLLRLLKEARLDCNKEDFLKYKDKLEKLYLSIEQKHTFIHEKILYNLDFNDIEIVEKMCQEWNVGLKEIDWGIKKAVIYSRINEKEKSKEMFEAYLQTIRSLLAIQMDDYHLLSLESVVLHNRNKITREWDYGYDRLRSLSNKYCNANKELDRILISIKKYENTLGTRQIKGFDPGTTTVSSSMGDYMKQELLDSYAVLQIQENVDLFVNNIAQYELALKNLEVLYPLYSQIKSIQHVNVKKIDEIFSREFVFKLDDYYLRILVNMLENAISINRKSNIDVNVTLEILSRIYFALSIETRKEIDVKIIEFINRKESFWIEDNKVLSNLLKRMFYTKNNKEAKDFCEQLINITIKSQMTYDKSMYKSTFFEPLLVVFEEKSRLSQIHVSEDQLNILFENLNNQEDYSKNEVALIRLTFLALNNSLSEKHFNRYKSIIKQLPTKREQGISDFLFSSVFDKIIHSDQTPSTEEQQKFIKKDIPKFYNKPAISYSLEIEDYFQELMGVFVNYIGCNKKTTESTIYKNWLEKFYFWWESQKEGLFRKPSEGNDYLPFPDYLKIVINALKNNIWGAIPKEYLEQVDKEKAIQIFSEISQKRPELSYYLIPCMQRLDIDTGFTLDFILDELKDYDREKVQAVTRVLYDYLIFISLGEINEDHSRIKHELFQILKYGSQKVLKEVIDLFKYTFKNAPNIFKDNECQEIIKFANNYLKGIKGGNVEISTLDDFELLASYVSLVAYVYKNKSEIVGNRFNEWKNYIRNHRLPEVRLKSDFFDVERNV